MSPSGTQRNNVNKLNAFSILLFIMFHFILFFTANLNLALWKPNVIIRNPKKKVNQHNVISIYVFRGSGARIGAGTFRPGLAATALVLNAGGKPSTWFPPGRLVVLGDFSYFLYFIA